MQLQALAFKPLLSVFRGYRREDVNSYLRFVQDSETPYHISTGTNTKV